MNGPPEAGAPAQLAPEPAGVEGIVLSSAAGAVDGIGYLLFHVFTAHVTGNTVRAGTAIGTGQLRDALGGLFAVGLFAVGVAVGAVTRSACERRGRSARGTVLAVSAGLLAGFALVGRWGPTPAAASVAAGWRAVAAVAAAAVGIGSANAAFPKVGGRRVRTFITGTVVELVEGLVAAVGANGAERRASLGRAGALGGVWVAYLGGSVLSGVAGVRFGSAAAFLPASALLLVAAVEHFRRTRAPRVASSRGRER